MNTRLWQVLGFAAILALLGIGRWCFQHYPGQTLVALMVLALLCLWGTILLGKK